MSTKRSAMVASLPTTDKTPIKKPVLSYDEGEEFPRPPTPYLTPQRDSISEEPDTLCLVSASCKRPLDEPGYDLSDLPSTKANRLLYNELMNRKAATLHRPDIQELIQRSIVCIEWAKFGGGGRCDQRLIDDVEARTNFLHSCLVACREVREGENLSMFYDTMHDDLVLLEKTIGGVWARPRKAGEEWRYVPQSVQGALRNEPETLDGLEEFLVTTDLLYAIVSSTGLSNLLLFGNKFPLERKGYLEDRLMMEYTCFKYFGDNADIYGDDGQLLDSNDAKKILKWRLDDQTLEKRLAIICDFVGSSFKDLAKHGMLELELTSWSDKPFEVDVDKEPKPLTFEEKDHLSQHAITLKICLREIINNNGFLKKIKVDSHDTMGPSGPILEFSAVGSKDKQATFPPKEHLAWQNAGNFKDRLGVSYRHRGYRFPDEVNHRGKVFDVLREELKHAIQCWNWLWSQHKDAICEHLYSVIGYAYVSSDEEDKEEVDSGGERPLDEATLDDATPADNDSINIALPSVGNSFTDQKEMRLELTTPPTVEVTYESGIVKEFTVEPQLDENKDIVDVPSTARKKKSYRAHIEIPESQLESQLDGASRVCPETKETWWVDMPPHFIFGETPSMAKAESDHMEEDLEKGKHELAHGFNTELKGKKDVKPVAKFGKATRSGKECSGKDKEQAIAVLDEDCIMDAELHSDSPSYLPHLAEELRESRVGKARVVNILTPTPTPTSRKASSNDLPIISSTSSLRKTSIGWEATSTVSRKVSAGKTSTTMMLPIKTQIIEAPNRTHDAGSSWSCGVCGKKLRSLELANIHATKAGHTKEFHKLNKDIVGIADSSLHEESPVEEDVVETSPSSPLQAQSSKATDVKTSTSIAHLDTTRKVRSGLWQHDTPIVFKAPTSTSYAMAPAVGPDHYQCRWGDCDFHDNPHKLACHVLKTHLDSDWTLEGFKCEWSACTDRVRLVRGIHQHCLDVHIPPLERPFWSGPLPPLHSQPQHSRQVKFQVETREKDGSEAQFEHEVATAAIQETEHTTDSTQETTHEADPDRMDIVINLMKESVISLTQESEFEVDSDSSPDVEPEHGGPEQDTEPTTDSSEETETENESKAVLSSPPLPSVLNSTRSTSLYLPHTTLATLTPSRGGLRQYLPIFSNFSSPFTSCFSIGGKRKRGSESGDKENVEDTEEIGNTPSKGNKRIKIGGDGKKVVKGRDLALGRSHRWSMGFG